MTKFVFISDTHSKHSEISLPPGDVLIHCGDMTNRGGLIELYNFTAWMKKQQFKHKIVIAGNHDFCFENQNKEEALVTMKQFDITYLENSSVIVEGFKIYGSPASPFFYNWAFNYQRGFEIAKIWKMIPDDTEILCTHGPPRGILDVVNDGFGEIHVGCDDLNDRINQLNKLQISAFGHIHNQERQILRRNKITYINAAIVNNRHQVIKSPVEIEL